MLFPFVFTAGEIFSQYKLLEPVRITKDQGLPTNDVRCILKGHDGFMWLGTTEGLCRFDGYQFKTYKPGELQNPVGTSNAVYTVLSIGDKIWMGTNQGVSVLNTKNETFRHYFFRDDNENGQHDTLRDFFYEPVVILYRDRQNIIWAGTRNKGMWVFDTTTAAFKRIRHSRGSYPKIIPTQGTENSVLSITQSSDNDSVIWAGTTAGLEKINKYTGQVEWYTFQREKKDYQVALNAFRRLYHHEDGLLYTGSWRAGINVFDPVKKTLQPLEIKNQHYFSGVINSIIRKSKTELWITTSEGLYIYDLEKKYLTNFWINNIKEDKLFGISCIDEEGRIWGTNRSGIQYFDYTTQQFARYSLTHLSDNEAPLSFYVESDSTGNVITVCPLFTNAVFRFNKISKSWTKLPFKGLSKFTNGLLIVRGFKETEPGVYLVATDQDLYTFSEKTGELSKTKNHPDAEYNRWGEILKDQWGDLWISADADGVIRWNKKTGLYKKYKNQLMTGRGANRFVRASNLFGDSKGNIWFTRVGGFSAYLRSPDTVVNFINRTNPVNSFDVVNGFAEDKYGKVWVSSENGWFGYIDSKNPEKGVIKKFNLRERNIEGFLGRLATDAQGNVWGYTEKMMIRINADDLSFSTFSFEYGIREPDFFNFNFLPSGEIIFGSQSGIILANIEELKINTELPVPYISQINIQNQPADSTTYSNGELNLKYNRNFITFFFSAKAYTMSNGVKFRYRLQNFDNWTESEGGRFVNYTNIPPGSYTFQLQAANNEGKWSPQTVELPVYISTPWFRTWWFRIGLLILAVDLAYVFYKYRVNQVKKKEKIKSQYEKRLANVEMTALLAQMNPHFLFNSLNSIDSYIIRNESAKASEYLNNFARLMRLILQNSRSNYISLKDELEALDLYLQMESLRFKDKFRYNIVMEENIDTSSIQIPPMLIQPYVENAIWHGLMHKKDETAGRVSIHISQKGNNLVCIIEDNGIGREKAAEIKAGKPGSHKRSMGMQITQDRIEMINKLYNTNTRVEVTDLVTEESKAAGTRVELVIPY